MKALPPLGLAKERRRKSPTRSSDQGKHVSPQAHYELPAMHSELQTRRGRAADSSAFALLTAFSCFLCKITTMAKCISHMSQVRVERC